MDTQTILRRSLAVVLNITLGFVATGTARAGLQTVDGAQDPSFGTGGVALADLTSFHAPGLGALGVAVAPSGAIYAGSGGPAVDRFLLTRYSADGVRDLNFGTAGVASAKPAADALWAYQLRGVAVQSDGKPLAWGIAEKDGNTDIVVCRYTVAGTLDAGFGASGCRRIGLDLVPNGREAPIDLMLLPGDAMYIAGLVQTPAFSGSNRWEALLMRLTASGNLDTGFHNVGWRPWNQGGAVTTGSSLALTADGTILLGGEFRVGEAGVHRFVAQFSNTGSWIGAFGNGGSATVNFDSFAPVADSKADLAVSLLVDGQGRIYDCGFSRRIQFNKDYHVTIARFTPNGQLDPSFGQGGRMQRVFADVFPTNIVRRCLLQNGRLVVGLARSGSEEGAQSAMALMRFTDSGDFDPEFGFGGLMDYPLDIGGNGQGREFGGFIAPQGRNLIVGGSARATNSAPFRLALFRVLKPDGLMSDGFEQP